MSIASYFEYAGSSYQENFLSKRENIFQKMRDEISQNASNVISLVNQRKLELEHKIDNWEIEYNNKNKQIEKGKQELRQLRDETRKELDRNSLFDVQSRIVHDIDEKIEKLKKQSQLQLDFSLTLSWDFGALSELIGRIDVEFKPKESTAGRPRQLCPSGRDKTITDYFRTSSLNYHNQPMETKKIKLDD